MRVSGGRLQLAFSVLAARYQTLDSAEPSGIPEIITWLTAYSVHVWPERSIHSACGLQVAADQVGLRKFSPRVYLGAHQNT